MIYPIHKIIRITATVLLVLGLCLQLPAQTKTGTTVGQFLKIQPSSRAAGMGNAGVSLSGEVTAAFYNPASLGRLDKSSAQFTYSRWLADITYNYGAAAVRFGTLGTFLLQITALNSGEIDVRTVEQPLGTGERYSVTNFALGVGYGRMLTDKIGVGVQLNYVQEKIWHSSTSGFGVNMGVQYEIIENGPTLGASVSNFGPKMGYDGRDLYVDYDLSPSKHGDNNKLPAELRTDTYPLPILFRVGVSYPIRLGDFSRLLLAVDALHPNDNTESVNAGGEWMLWDNFFLRGGYRNLFQQDLEGGLVLGAGLQIAFSGYEVHFDYAWADYGVLEQTQRMTLGLRF